MLVIAGAVALFHLMGLGSYPILGTTEGRYAEMAHKMVESHRYLVPMFTENSPFWGKPPLSMWLSAASMNIFGVSEFAVRLPSWLASVGTGLLMYRLAAPNRSLGALAMLLWLSTYLGYVAFGKVHTDSVLTFTATLALVGLYLGYAKGLNGWMLAGYLGVGLGLLAKGPVVLVYVGLPMATWIVIEKRLVSFLSDGRTWLGVLLAISIAAPWYLAAENAYPGFLNYFLLGEHFQRFLDPGWVGDLYGAGHERPKGMMLLFLAESLLPWSILIPLFAFFFRSRNRQRPSMQEISPVSMWFLFSWALVPILFFCLSANVVRNYVMPTMGVWCILLAILFERNVRYKPFFAILIVLIAALYPLAKMIRNFVPDLAYTEPRNQKPLVDDFLSKRKSGEQLFSAGRRLYAGEFYYAGIQYANEPTELPATKPFYLAMRIGREPFPEPAYCEKPSTINGYRLFYCAPF